MPVCICAMLSADTASLPEDIALEVRLHLSDLTGWIESAMEAGQAGALLHLRSSPAAEADAFLATVHGAMLSARAFHRPEIFEEVMGVVMERLAAPA
jgi:TetR/AcrR family transcriptional repressor of nem operon